MRTIIKKQTYLNPFVSAINVPHLEYCNNVMIIHLMKAPHCGVAVDAVPEVGLGGVTRLVREEVRAWTLEPG